MRKKVLRGTLPRYVQARTLADGNIQYRFNPPQQFIDANIVKRDILGTDLRKVRPIAAEYNKRIDEYREQQEKIKGLQEHHTVNKLVEVFTESYDFRSLKDKTKKDYIYFLGVMQQTLGDTKYRDVSPRIAKTAYDEWLERGIHFANHVMTACVRLYNFARERDYCEANPFSTVRRKTPEQRQVVWSKEDVVKFLDCAYNNFEYRSVGLIVHMAYEWCQRVGDMRLLKWDNIDLDLRRLDLEQSKRRSHVHLPIDDDLAEMLQQQKNEFGFQPYVAPQTRPSNGVYEPYTIYLLSHKGRAIMKEAGLSDDLRLMDLRRTGTTEMVEAGVSMAQIMSVTGHANPQSVKPYMKHTYTSANSALSARKANKNHDTS